MSQDDELIDGGEAIETESVETPDNDPYGGLDPASAKYLLSQVSTMLGPNASPAELHKYLEAGVNAQNAALEPKEESDEGASTDEYGEKKLMTVEAFESYKSDQKKLQEQDQFEVDLASAMASVGISTPEDRLACKGYISELGGRVGVIAAAKDWAGRYLRRAPAVGQGQQRAVSSRRSSGLNPGERNDTREESIDDIADRMFGSGGRSELQKSLLDLRKSN